MLIENVMYFALGLLVSGLLALMILPAVWRRAVRLTKKRIEAATPMTMAEFRADKDQLRAEFALSTRRLEMNVEALRRRLAEQLRDINRKKTELGGIRSERDQHLEVVRDLEEREGELRRRVLELEKEGADLAQRLRMRDREYTEKASQLEAAREALRSTASPKGFTLDGRPLSGDYNRDIEELLGIVEIERKRAQFLETQNRSLIGQLEEADRRGLDRTEAVASLRSKLASETDRGDAAASSLVEAEARIAEAESRVTTILAETAKVVADGADQRETLLADKLSLEAELDALRGKVSGVEQTLMAEWDAERMEQSHLRERLNDIASDVSRIVYALEGQSGPEDGESLYARVQKYAGPDPVPAANGRDSAHGPLAPTPHSAVSDRLKAIRELQDGN